MIQLADPERLKGYKNDDDENSYNVGIMLADACHLLLTDKGIKRGKAEILQLVEDTIDRVQMYTEKKFI